MRRMTSRARQVLPVRDQSTNNGSDPLGLEPTSERLLDAAARLFRTQGYAATTTRELSRVLGIEKGSLYYHIRSKEDLLYRVCVDSLTHIRDATAKASGAEADPGAKLRAAIRAHVVSMLADRDKHATMLIELRGLSPGRRAQVIKLRDEYELSLREIIKGCQRGLILRQDMEPKVLALALLNLLNWTIFWYAPGGKYSPEYLGETLIDLFLQGAGVGTPKRSRSTK
jgi:AcrR family transcriptional regulator